MTTAVTLYGADSCRYTNRTRGQLDSLGVAYEYVNLEQQGGSSSRPAMARLGKQQTPTVEIGTDSCKRRLVRPGDWELETELIRCGLIGKRAERPPSRTIIRGPRSIL